MTDSAGFTTPILLLVYRRPDTTRQVFEGIRAVRPKTLYVAGDGPRTDVPGEGEMCAQARRLATNIDWACDLQTLFRDKNLGCGLGVSSAITWFFHHVREGIILEDDCVPSPSFFGFCAELLSYYRDEPKVMHIGGDNFQYGRVRGNASYYFSKFTHVWGWATWARAWQAYDFNLRPTWEMRDTWDTQWQLAVERAGGLTVVPNVNLVRNVGFGSAATHTATPERAATLEAAEMSWPLKHPTTRVVDHEADRFTYYIHFRNINHPGWIWLYRFWDYLYGSMKSLKRKLRVRL